MKTGQVADLAEVSVDTVRFDERRGVLAACDHGSCAFADPPLDSRL